MHKSYYLLRTSYDVVRPLVSLRWSFRHTPLISEEPDKASVVGVARRKDAERLLAGDPDYRSNLDWLRWLSSYGSSRHK